MAVISKTLSSPANREKSRFPTCPELHIIKQRFQYRHRQYNPPLSKASVVIFWNTLENDGLWTRSSNPSSLTYKVCYFGQIRLREVFSTVPWRFQSNTKASGLLRKLNERRHLKAQYLAYSKYSVNIFNILYESLSSVSLIDSEPPFPGSMVLISGGP